MVILTCFVRNDANSFNKFPNSDTFSDVLMSKSNDFPRFHLISRVELWIRSEKKLFVLDMKSSENVNFHGSVNEWKKKPYCWFDFQRNACTLKLISARVNSTQITCVYHAAPNANAEYFMLNILWLVIWIDFIVSLGTIAWQHKTAVHLPSYKFGGLFGTAECFLWNLNFNKAKCPQQNQCWRSLCQPIIRIRVTSLILK